MKTTLRQLEAILLLLACNLGANAAEHLRPPAVPLVAHDPYFSIWSPVDKLTDADTVHWTGKPHRLTSLVRIDGKGFRLMGKEPANVPALPQTSLEVTPTRTICTFEGEGVRLTLTFMTPLLPDKLEFCSRPVTYVKWRYEDLTTSAHKVRAYFDASPEIAVNDPRQAVTWSFQSLVRFPVMGVGTVDQPVLRSKGDDLRIDWGTFYVMAMVPLTNAAIASAEACRRSFIESGILPHTIAPGTPRVVKEDAPVLAFADDLSPGSVGWKGLTALLCYDDIASIRYFGTNLPPAWRWDPIRPSVNALNVLRAAMYDFSPPPLGSSGGAHLDVVCAKFDQELMADLRKVGGEQYAQLCALAYRQTFAGNKIVADANGQPLMFPKENFSNGCIGTVDVLFPQAPFFLVLSPALTKAMLVPILDYAASPRWPYGYAPHDLGTYPHATGQVYGMDGSDGDRMPVEESGNMLIMLAALAKSEGNAEFAKPYWHMLTKWADYLVEHGLDPTNQLCSADMFGHLPRNANLALKAIIGLGGFAQLCQLTGHPEEAKKYLAIARDYAAKWQELAQDEGHTRLAYHQPGSWSMKHNLIWDRILGTKLFPDSVGDAEIAWYLKVQKRYGLPVDNRTDTCLIDWAVWSIALARNETDFQKLFAPLYAYANETPSRVPLSDWFTTTDAKMKGFQARPVVGGLLMKLLADPALWTKWAKRGANTRGPWAPIPTSGPVKEIVPTAQTAQVKWRYTLEKPADDWMKSSYDDSAWKEGVGGFGTQDTPGAIIGTEWNTKQIWLRREFTLPDRVLKNPRLRLIYDEDPEVYLNGLLAAKLTGWVTSYDEADIASAALATLKPGKNVMAVHASQTYGGQCIDVGIAEEGDLARPAPKPNSTGPSDLHGLRQLFDFPVRDTSICVGPDRTYYLTGTTGHPTWWNTNEGIRVWKSTDLTNWVPLGLVWSFEQDATWQKPIKGGNRAIWAPEIHFIKGTFWLTYCVNYGGTGLLKSSSGKAEGPYLDVKTDGPLTAEIDASLFADDDGKVYFVFQDGKIALMNDDMTGLAEQPRLLTPANFKHVGFEGAFLTKINGRYQLVCAEFNQRDGVSAYDCMVASAEHIYGPYGDRYLTLPQAGHNVFFKDLQGQWWATFFGNDPLAPWRERPGILPIALAADGQVQPRKLSSFVSGSSPPEQSRRDSLPGLRKLMDTPLRDTSICRGPDGTWYMTGTIEPFYGFNEGIKVWKSPDLTNWTGLGFVWKYGASPWHQPYLEKRKSLWAPEIHFLKNTFWLTYSMPGWDGPSFEKMQKTSGSGLLKSTTGRPEGPYEDMQPNERLGDEIDASLFQDDDGTVYFVWHSGKIAKMKPDMSGLGEPYHWLKTTTSDANPKHHSGLCANIFGIGSFDHVGYEGMFIFKTNGIYHLCCAENFEGRYSCTIATSPNLYGPYGERYEAIPHGGHNTFIKDDKGQWWSTYFGSDGTAPWEERPGILPVQLNVNGTLTPAGEMTTQE